MVKTSTVRAEIARLGLRRSQIARDLGVGESLVSQTLTGKRKRPELLSRIWGYVECRRKEENYGA